MKNLFRSLLATAILFGAAACTTENISTSVVGNGDPIEVTFTADLGAMGSRTTTGTGENVNKLTYNVYDANNDALLSDLCGTADRVNGVFKFDLVMVKGMTYDIVLWAECETNEFNAYNVNGKTVTVNYDGAVANDERYDAFYKFVDGFDPTAHTPSFTLTRPLAQLNAATDDKDDVEDNGISITTCAVKVLAYTSFNIEEGTVSDQQEKTFSVANVVGGNLNDNATYEYLAVNYLFVPTTANSTALTNVKYTFTGQRSDNTIVTFTGTEYNDVPLKSNHRTNILGALLTKPTDFVVDIKADFGTPDEVVNIVNVASATELQEAIDNAPTGNGESTEIILDGDINLNDLLAAGTLSTRAATTALTIPAGKVITLNLNGKKLYATSTKTGGNYDMIDVRGTLTVTNGTAEVQHTADNMGWSASTNVFNITAGGVLNLDDVTAKNLGGSDMAFVAHLNNWGEVTLNVENCTLESTYVPVRVFNSGPNMNNVTIKNSTLTGVSAAFWVHNYTVADFGTEAKAEAQKALLNLNIYKQGNTFSPDVNGIRYGFTNSIRTDAYGITKTVSDDGSVVTLGSIFDNGLIRRGVAGAEENTTITKAIVGEGIATLYDRTFRRFYALETVELPSTLTTIGATGSGVFQSCTALKNIVIPESVTVLGKGTFQECSSLTSINIPTGVTRIEENCLRATGLVEVEFHAGVTYFGAMSFRDCKQLKKVVINAPEFTVEANAFGVMAGALPGTVIDVANAEMKAYLENTLSYANQFTIVAPDAVSNAEDLAKALAEGKNVTLTQDITTESATTAPYGNKYAFKQDGGIIDGNGHELHMECYGDDYGIMTSGGTIKNITIKEGCRAVMIMYPQQDVILDNVNIGGDGVLYPINTGEGGAEGVNLIVTNSVLAGWTSYGLIESATFTNVEFKQGTYYNNIYGRVLKPYVNTVLTNCSFVKSMNLDLSALTSGHKITMKNCTVDGQAVTAEVFTIPSNDAQYDTELFTVDLPGWATSINDCVIFE